MAIPEEKMGLIYSALSAFFFSLMGVGLYQVKLQEPNLSFFVTSFARVEINLLILIVIAAYKGDVRALWGDFSRTLWLRGIFGAAAVICTFYSLQRIGIGEGSFLNALNAVFIALLAPWLLQQKNSFAVWMAIVGSLAGAAFLLKPWETTGDLLGRLAGLASGFLSALAYIMIARTKNRVSPSTVVFYLCIVSTVVHLFVFLFKPMPWPQQAFTYLLLFAVGATATAAQYYLTLSFQKAPAALNAAVSYLYPVFSLFWQLMLFGERLSWSSWVGTVLILFCGVALPFVSSGAKRALTKAG